MPVMQCLLCRSEPDISTCGGRRLRLSASKVCHSVIRQNLNAYQKEHYMFIVTWDSDENERGDHSAVAVLNCDTVEGAMKFVKGTYLNEIEEFNKDAIKEDIDLLIPQPLYWVFTPKGERWPCTDVWRADYSPLSSGTVQIRQCDNFGDIV